MKLTKEQAIEEHRKKWNWIADQYKNGSEEIVEVLETEYFKRRNIKLEADSPCCDYAFRKLKELVGDDFVYLDLYGCDYCPVDFGDETCTCDISPYSKMFDHEMEKLQLGQVIDSRYMEELARQIANLPEREKNESNKRRRQ